MTYICTFPLLILPALIVGYPLGLPLFNWPINSPWLPTLGHFYVDIQVMATTHSLPEPGDHVSIGRGLIPGEQCKYGWYRHHMLVVEAEEICYNSWKLKVIHLSGKLTECQMKEEVFPEVIEAEWLRTHEYKCKYSGEEAIKRARARMELEGDTTVYKLLSFNCEHFVTWAKTGRTSCRQLQQVGVGAAGGAGGVAAGGVAGMWLGSRIVYLVIRKFQNVLLDHCRCSCGWFHWCCDTYPSGWSMDRGYDRWGSWSRRGRTSRRRWWLHRTSYSGLEEEVINQTLTNVTFYLMIESQF